MIPNPALTFLPERIVDELHVAGAEFRAAQKRGEVPRETAQKYHNALWAFTKVLWGSPYSPIGMLDNPSEHDSTMMGYVRDELDKAKATANRVSNYLHK